MELTKDETIKASIVQAAQKLFQHYGLSKTTMEDIAKALGKSKSSLYYYYSTKEEIFQAVVQQEKDIIFTDIKAAIGKVNSAKDKFKIFAVTKFKEIKKRQILHKIILDEIYDNVCLFEIIRKKYDITEIDIIKSILRHGVTTGEFFIENNKKLEAISLICADLFRSRSNDDDGT